MDRVAVSAADRASAPAISLAARQDLCQAVPYLERLTVPWPRQMPMAPGTVGKVAQTVVVTRPATVQVLARKLCGLPLLSTMHACFANLGGWFLLSFQAAGSARWPVWVNLGGCQEVIGAGPQHRAAFFQRFFPLLKTAMARSAGGTGVWVIFPPR